MIWIGLGGAGGQLVSAMGEAYPEMHTIALNQDKKSVQKLQHVEHTLCFGEGIFHERSAQKQVAIHFDALRFLLGDSDDVGLLVSLGGRYGRLVVPILCAKLQALGKKVSMVALLPFDFEGPNRMDDALHVLSQLTDAVTVLVSSNQDYLVASKSMGLDEMFQAMYEPLLTSVIQVCVHQGDILPEARIFLQVYQSESNG
ncbi:MAG: hypothetical protein Q9M19_02595 [Mariprofundaceae bacterium]|nr:hypothetical protein [Mariprofundaceae bacterium]